MRTGIIRNAVPSDGDALKELHRRSSLVYNDARDTLMAHPEVFGVATDAIAGGHVRVIVRDERIVAFATLPPGPRRSGELEDLFVEPELMEKGLGRRLIDDAVAACRARGLQRIEVTANLNAQRFYEKVGFVIDGDVATQFGIGTRMHREVPAD